MTAAPQDARREKLREELKVTTGVGGVRRVSVEHHGDTYEARDQGEWLGVTAPNIDDDSEDAVRVMIPMTLIRALFAAPHD